MKDMLVRLIGLPDVDKEEIALKKKEDIVFRRAIGPEKQ